MSDADKTGRLLCAAGFFCVSSSGKGRAPRSLDRQFRQRMHTPSVILAIAGSDPSGGAGIQADIKTVSALGGYAAAAVTAVTVQNTRGVSVVEYLAPELVAQQVEAVMEDLRPAAVKIGMTGSAATIEAVATVLRRHDAANIILDPVMRSTGGRALLPPEAVETLCDTLFPLCRLITPNLPEASALLGMPVSTVEQMRTAAERLHARYGCAVLVKGGHLDAATATDVLFDGTWHLYTSPRIPSRNLHGTGCTLSSAIAALCAAGDPLAEAVGKAKAYLGRAIEAAAPLHIGSGNGPLWHFPDRTETSAPCD